MDNEEALVDVDAIKEKGNQLVKDGKFKEAVRYYTQAIEIDSENFSLYSNRSLAHLRLKNYYMSLQDANETIRRQPLWAKGFFRRAEVEAAVGLTEDAVLSYTKALQLQPLDENILQAIKRTTIAQRLKKDTDVKVPWLCSCIGLIIGVFLVIFDYVLVEHDTPMNPLKQVAFSLAVAGCGLALGKGYIMLENKKMEKSLMPPDTEEQAADKLPWKYRLIGLAVGIILVFIDCTITNLLGLKNPAAQIAFAIAFAVGGWALGTVMRHLKLSELEPPINLIVEEFIKDKLMPDKISSKYTKAQARYRYKRGKM